MHRLMRRDTAAEGRLVIPASCFFRPRATRVAWACGGLLNELPRERTPEQREEQGAAARQAAPERRIGEHQLPQDTDARLQQAVGTLGRDNNKTRSLLNCGGGVAENTDAGVSSSHRSVFSAEGSVIITYTSITWHSLASTNYGVALGSHFRNSFGLFLFFSPSCWNLLLEFRGYIQRWRKLWMRSRKHTYVRKHQGFLSDRCKNTSTLNKWQTCHIYKLWSRITGCFATFHSGIYTKMQVRKQFACDLMSVMLHRPHVPT